LDDAASVADSEQPNGEKVTLEVESNVQTKGEVETSTTNVRISMPEGSAEMPMPENPEEMIEKAKEMVEEAKKIDGESSKGKSKSKRKAEVLEDDDDDDEDQDADKEMQPAKKARLLEQQIKKEKVRNRAIMGVAATLAIG